MGKAMIGSAKFWIVLAVFQVVFGLAVFAITRSLYIDESANAGSNRNMTRQPALLLPDAVRDSFPAQSSPLASNPPTFGAPPASDPAEIARQADESFTNRQYDRAADLYQQLLAFGPNVDTYNNLGITLHYLGRSTEAVQHLNTGVALDATHQRIWLTLGFVNSQLGNTEEARTALTRALELGADNDVGQSAQEMLEKL